MNSIDILLTGFLVADIVVADLDKIADPGELVLAPKGIKLSVGGHPANISIDLVKLGYSPKRILLVGTVGDDIFGDFIINTLSSYGILLAIDKLQYTSTNKNVILVVKGEDRRFHVEISSSKYLSPDKIIESIDKYKPKLFYLAAGIIDKTDEVIDEVFKEAKRRGCLTFLDLVKPIGKKWNFIFPAFNYVDLFHCNDVEAKDMMQVQDLKLAMMKLLKMGIDTLFVTLGEKGAILANENIIIKQPAFKVKVVDPTGAGDAFCAGVIFKLFELFGERVNEIKLSRESIKVLAEILAYAQAVGASACTAPGTTEGVSKERVNEIISQQYDKIIKNQKIEEW